MCDELYSTNHITLGQHRREGWHSVEGRSRSWNQTHLGEIKHTIVHPRVETAPKPDKDEDTAVRIQHWKHIKIHVTSYYTMSRSRVTIARFWYQTHYDLWFLNSLGQNCVSKATHEALGDPSLIQKEFWKNVRVSVDNTYHLHWRRWSTYVSSRLGKPGYNYVCPRHCQWQLEFPSGVWRCQCPCG